MASDRFQMINTLFHAMIDDIIIQLFRFSMNCLFFFYQYYRWISPVCYPPTKSDGYIFASSVHPSVHSVRPSALLSIRNHVSVLIFRIRIILCTNDMYHVLSISYKFRQNRPLSRLSYGPCFSKGIYNAKPISAIFYDDLHISPKLLYLTTSHYRP